jgi:tryptophan synthase beta chain
MSYQKFHDGVMTDYRPTDEELEASFAQLPVIE